MGWKSLNSLRINLNSRWKFFGAVGAISTASQWFGVPGELLAVSTLVEEVKVSSVWELHSAEGGGGD